VPTYLEDLEPGQRFESVGRTVTEADIANFAGVSGDFYLLHTNEEWVRANTPFEGRIAHGLLVLAISSALKTPVLGELEVIAYLEATRRFTAPTYPGDTIHVVHTIEEARLSKSRPGTGVVSISVYVLNQRGETVQNGRDVSLVAARPRAS
jgi:3-hydroxybutyryl-CoA dehydratase